MPEVVPAATVKTVVNDTGVPTAKSAFAEQIICPVAPTAGVVPQVHPVGAAMEVNVVFTGTSSYINALGAVAGPLLTTVCTNERFPPAATEVGVTVCVMPISVNPTVTVVVVVLFVVLGSVPVSLTVAVFVMVVPFATPAFTSTTIVKFPLVELAASAALAVQVIAPVPPTAGTVPQVQPAGGVAEINVVLAGVFCVSDALRAWTEALLLETVSVYVMLPRGATVVGAAVCVIEMSGV